MVSSVFSGHHQFSFVSNVASQIIELLSVQSNVDYDPEPLKHNEMLCCSERFLPKVAAYVTNKLFKRFFIEDFLGIICQEYKYKKTFSFKST